MHELELSNGVHVRVRPIPPHVVIQFNKGVTKSLPSEPKEPTRTVKMADGHVEQDIVDANSPEWEAYQDALAGWQQACNDAMVEANDEYNNLQRDYAIIEWSFDGGETWHKDVPPTWAFPSACVRAGIKPCGNERVDYIGIELLTTTDDWLRVRQIADGDTSNVTDEEAARVRAGFRTGDRRARDATTKKGGWFRRLALKVSRGNADGKSVGVDA